jgi:hypothetical protein
MREAPEIAAAFKSAGLDIADAGEPFIPFDFETAEERHLPHRQFVRAYVVGDRVIVWYFHGGRGPHFHVVQLFRLVTATKRRPFLSLLDGGLAGPLCRATQAMLDGISPHTEK